jgi:regulator of sigma E protease
MLIFASGEPQTQVATLAGDSPAAAAGLKAGDEILAVNGEPVSSWADISEKLAGAANEASGPRATLRVRHEDGAEQTIQADMYKDTDGAYRVGIMPVVSHSPGYFFRSFALGADATWGMTKMMYKVLGDLFTGRAGIDQLTGPIGIVKAVGDTAKVGGGYVAELAALISLNLGIVNLLPLPALDGGRILFLIIRLFTGRRVSDALEARIHTIGILALFALMAYITLIDVNRFIIQ